ncbi:hypothetical protein BDZ97DRAFT_1916888 [Flammula alnicola]|nr:hypothetical protein BDZ97DRAFT_1916888 [Flammula alnicola]
MIGNSLLDYIKIRLGIGALRVVAPASVAYLVCCALKPDWFNLPLALAATAEAAFYLFVYLPRRSRLQSPPRHPPPTLTRVQRQLIFNRCIEAGRHGSSTDAPYPTGWFLPNNTTPKREDVIDWLLWALFSSSREETSIEDYREELDGYLKEIEKIVGKELDEGHSSGDRLRSMRITLDPVLMLHRPLIWYMIVALVDAYTSVVLAYLGFKHYTPREPEWRRTFPPRPVLYFLSRPAPPGVVTPYWYRQHTSASKLPVVFLHGIGIGLYPYISFLRSIIYGGDSDVGILLPEMMSICMHMTPRSVPPRGLMLASLNLILESLQEEEEAVLRKERQLNPVEDADAEIRRPLLSGQRETLGSESRRTGWDRVLLSAHSYGTFVAGWIVRECVDTDLVEKSTSGSTEPSVSAAVEMAPGSRLAKKIAHLVLVDPIPILLSNPAVAHNFLYREPSTVCPHTLGSAHDLNLETDLALPTASSPQNMPLTKRPEPSWFSSASAWQLWYFASRDADIARTLYRSFFWTEGGIWREEIGAFVNGDGVEESTDGVVRRKGRNVAVVLGGMDQIVPSEAIRRYLTREVKWKENWIGKVDLSDSELVDEEESGVRGSILDRGRGGGGGYGTSLSGTADAEGKLEVLFNPRLDHAVIFDDPRWTSPLTEVVKRYVREC